MDPFISFRFVNQKNVMNISMKLRKDKINMSDPLKQQQKSCMYSISKLYQYLWIKIYLSMKNNMF